MDSLLTEELCPLGTSPSPPLEGGFRQSAQDPGGTHPELMAGPRARPEPPGPDSLRRAAARALITQPS